MGTARLPAPSHLAAAAPAPDTGRPEMVFFIGGSGGGGGAVLSIVRWDVEF